METKFKIGDRVIAKWIHGEGHKGTIEKVMEGEMPWGTTEVSYLIKLDSGRLEDRPEIMVEALTEETDLFWVK